MRKLAETKREGDEGVAWITEGDLHRSREKMTVSEERGNEEENDGGREREREGRPVGGQESEPEIG